MYRDDGRTTVQSEPIWPLDFSPLQIGSLARRLRSRCDGRHKILEIFAQRPRVNLPWFLEKRADEVIE
jgi:hypothetical protein